MMTRSPGSDRFIRPSRTCSRSFVSGSDWEIVAIVRWIRNSASLMLVHRASPRPSRVPAASTGASSAGRHPASRCTDAEGGKLFLKCSRLTFRADGLGRTLQQQLKAVIAFPADIFEYRHDI